MHCGIIKLLYGQAKLIHSLSSHLQVFLETDSLFLTYILDSVYAWAVVYSKLRREGQKEWLYIT